MLVYAPVLKLLAIGCILYDVDAKDGYATLSTSTGRIGVDVAHAADVAEEDGADRLPTRDVDLAVIEESEDACSTTTNCGNIIRPTSSPIVTIAFPLIVAIYLVAPDETSFQVYLVALIAVSFFFFLAIETTRDIFLHGMALIATMVASAAVVSTVIRPRPAAGITAASLLVAALLWLGYQMMACALTVSTILLLGYSFIKVHAKPNEESG